MSLNEEIDLAIRHGEVDWPTIRRCASELVAVADEAIAAGPADGLV